MSELDSRARRLGKQRGAVSQRISGEFPMMVLTFVPTDAPLGQMKARLRRGEPATCVPPAVVRVGEPNPPHQWKKPRP